MCVVVVVVVVVVVIVIVVVVGVAVRVGGDRGTVVVAVVVAVPGRLLWSSSVLSQPSYCRRRLSAFTQYAQNYMMRHAMFCQCRCWVSREETV